MLASAEAPSVPPIEGLGIVRDVVSASQADRLAESIDGAPLAPFRFGPWQGKRLTANFGSAYDYQRALPVPAPPLPAWLSALRDALVVRFGREPADFGQALLTRYDRGAGIGWHRDRPQYGSIIGLSLGSPAVMRLRRRLSDGRFARAALPLEPRAAYILEGPARWDWEHSIAPLSGTRYSVTLRTMRPA